MFIVLASSSSSTDRKYLADPSPTPTRTPSRQWAAGSPERTVVPATAPEQLGAVVANSRADGNGTREGYGDDEVSTDEPSA